MRNGANLRVFSEPNALVDDRPEGRRLGVVALVLALVLAFVLGAASALLWAWGEWRDAQPPSVTDGMR